MHRVFIALSLPEVVADALTQLQSGIDGARWRPVENFHLTLQFVGDVDRHGLDEVATALGGILAPGFQLTLSGCWFFGGKHPRLLYAGTKPSPELNHLQAKVEQALRRLGLPLENRKFVPHVTLAYLKHIEQDTVAAYAARHSLFSCGPFPVREFHLYLSHLGGDVSHYEKVETYPLSSV